MGVKSMARLTRITPAGVPVHIIQRGNNRQICFAADEDYIAYREWLTKYSREHGVGIHAWVLMTNHVHLLCTPDGDNSLSQMMQSLGRQYVRYFNQKYQRSGTLWEGRYKSCLIQEERYLLEVYRYIELNPLRANIVKNPGDYKWSSYQANGLGEKSELCTPHPEFLSLGLNSTERLSNYRTLLSHQTDNSLLEDIRLNCNKSMALGTDKFKNEMESITGRRLRPKKRGRPTGWRKEG